VSKYEVKIDGTYGWGEGLEQCPPGFQISWSAKGIGFGTLTVQQTGDGTFTLDHECMSREFCAAVFEALLEAAYPVGPEETRESAEAALRAKMKEGK
jgi:hypothetical protein